VVAVAAGWAHTVALKADGTVVAWGYNYYGQTNVPAGLGGVGDIAAGGLHTVALKGDGTVVAWGYNTYGQATVPSGLTGVVAVAAGWAETLAIKVDGTVVAWGEYSDVPTGLSGVSAIAAGTDYKAAIVPLRPLAELGTSSAITSVSAILHGSIQPYGKTTSAAFQYSTDGSFSSSASIPLTPADGTTPQSFSVPLTGLQPATTYFYRISATSTNGTTITSVRTFMTDPTNSEITISGLGIEIPKGDTSPWGGDGTEYGHLGTPGPFTDTTYSIANAGPDTLVLTDTPRVRLTGPNAADFTVTSQPAASVAAGQSTSFTVRFQPFSTGLKTATVSILNSDPDESAYTFAIQGSCGTGVMDARFSVDGVQSSVFTTSGTPRNTQGRDVVVQPDGKIVVVGFGHNGTSNDTVLARFLPDGTPDATFGTNGQARTDFGANDGCYSVGIQADGKIVVGGEADVGSHYDFALARYLPNGTLDPSFDEDGKVTTDWFAGNDSAAELLIQPDGKIIAVGTAGTPTGSHFALARYNADGSMDTRFGTGGKVNTAIGSLGANAYAAVLQLNGNIVVGGRSALPGGESFALARYTSSGVLDSSFGANGITTTTLASGEDRILGLALQPDGRILAVGRSFTAGISYDFGIARYLSNGSLDTSFDGDGMRTVGFGPYSDWAEAVEVQPDGKIVLSGFYSEASRQGMGILRLNSNGSYDQTYGPDGIVKITPGPTNDRLHGSALDANGNFVGAGFTTDSGGTSNLAVVRVLGASAPALPLVTASVAPAGAGLLISGQVQPAGASTTLTVDYGTTNALGSTATIGTFTGGGTQSFETTLYPGSLAVGANYYYRVTAASVNGTTTTDIQSFMAPPPDIQVEQPVGSLLVDGASSVNFGTAPLGTPVTRTFRVTNTGSSTLNVTALTLPEGYEHVGPFAAYVLEPNATHSFDVRFLANTVPGTFTGPMTIESNDPDAEGSFALGLTGRAALVYPGAMAIKQTIPSATNGVYTLDPDGPGGADPFDAYCDMTTNGGGWTLLLKANGSQTTFQYSSALWTNTTTLNDGSPGLDNTEFKSQGFSTIPFNALMVGLGTKRLQLNLPGLSKTSLRDMFSGGTLVASNSRTDWLALTPSPGNFTLMSATQFGGVNVTASGGGYLNVRVGMLMNNVADMVTPDAYVGVGASSWQGDLTTTAGASNYVSPVVHYPDTSYLFVRDTTPGAVPSYAAEVANSPASSITSDTAIVNGAVNPKGITTNVWFEYGTTTTYGSSTSSQAVGSGTSAVPVSANLIGLSPGTLYHYRLVAQNGVTTTYGADMTFTMVSTNANLSGLVLSQGALSPAFSSGTTQYAARVPASTLDMTLTATVADPNATFTLNGNAAVSNVPSPIWVSVPGENIFTVQVVAQDGVTTKNYVVTVTKTDPIFSGGDDFNDSTRDAAKWAPADIASGNGSLVEANGRLEYRVATPDLVEGFDEVRREWVLNSAVFPIQAFDVIVDVHNSVEPDADHNACIGITVTNLANAEDYLTLELFRSGPEGDGEGILAILSSAAAQGEVLPLTQPTDHPALTDACLRLTYDPGPGVFTASYDPTGRSDGLQWQEYGTFGISGLPMTATRQTSWSMPPGGGFKVSVTAFSEGLSITSGQVHADNFQTGTGAAGWRLTTFGIAEATGAAADDADPDGDGMVNFLEYAVGHHGGVAGVLHTPLSKGSGGMLEYFYPRSFRAVSDGIVFDVEWSDSLLPGSWSTEGVVSEWLSTAGGAMQMRALVPSGTGGRRFVRLRISPPPPP
jgi:uncharacterized delta-60 repeat protein